MEFNIDLDKLMLLVTILGSLITAIVTAVGSRNQTKETDASVEKTNNLVPVEVSEKLTGISLSLITNLQSQLADLEEDNKILESNLKECNSVSYASKIKLRKSLSKIRTIKEKHERYHGELKLPCVGYEVITTLVDELITELEKELGE